MLNFLKNHPDLNAILREVGNDCTPSPEKIFRVAQPVDGIKVVILGQDPYPAPGAATGLAFEVNGLTRWKTPFRQVSLKNIVRLLYSSYTGADPYKTPFSAIVEALECGDFSILSPDRLFSYWAENGVLLLNTALTCKPGYPGSHGELWRPFMNDLIEHIEDSAHPIWFLWGKEAQKYNYVQNSYCSRHPMLCSENWADDFLKNPCFRETSTFIDWLG